MRNLKKYSPLIGIALLSGCAMGNSDPIYLTRCPTLVSYPPAVMSQAADEITAMPPTAVLPQMVADYGTLRQRCRGLTEDGL